MVRRNPIRPQTTYSQVKRVSEDIGQAGLIQLEFPFNSYYIIKQVSVGCNAVNDRDTHAMIMLGTPVFVAMWPHIHLLQGVTSADQMLSYTNWEEHVYPVQGVVVAHVEMGAAGTAFMDVHYRNVHMGLDRPETYGDLPDLRERIRRFLS